MADEQHAEDLMRDAVSLTRRLECRREGDPEPTLIGLNDLDWLFVYFGSDPMYRFDELGRLRRAFVAGRLLRTTGLTLATMERQRDSTNRGSHNTQSTLARRDLSPEELEAFRQRMRNLLEQLYRGLEHAVITRQHPAEMAGIRDLMQERLQTALDSSEFLAPAIVKR